MDIELEDGSWVDTRDDDQPEPDLGDWYAAQADEARAAYLARPWIVRKAIDLAELPGRIRAARTARRHRRQLRADCRAHHPDCPADADPYLGTCAHPDNEPPF